MRSGDKMKFPAWFSTLVGLLMVGQWVFFLASGDVPELQTEPIALYFHLAAELATAVCLVAGGLALLGGKPWARGLGLFAAGMLAYTTIVSPGYFAQLGQWPLVGMFLLLLALDLVSAYFLIRGKI